MGNGQADSLQSLDRRANATRGLLLVYLGLSTLFLLMNCAILYYELTSPYGLIYALAFDSWQVNLLKFLIPLSAVAMILFTLLVIIAMMFWVYRAWANLRDMGLESLNYTPGWAVGSFFVPFINLVTPFRAMRELANRSAGEDVWQILSPVPDVSSWWSCFIAAMFLRGLLGYVALVDSMPYMRFVAPRGVNTGMVIVLYPDDCRLGFPLQDHHSGDSLTEI